ncbi:hypothetical protein [Hyalangium minutum]|uniref:Uncharacterized protein n=1 Tax=Hyalangium minutum TaxID=394096 RepID=A0A085W5P0_9BACT|nr:hypothetical protein [Hyalangium minutum]KFE63003.1 hypothetical protein DB31_3062 [Hyalangium minutum]
MSSPTPAAPAAPTPGPAGDADKIWLNADRSFLIMLAVFFPLAVASHFFCAILGVTFFFVP